MRLFLVVLLSTSALLLSPHSIASDGITKLSSAHSVIETVNKLEAIFAKKGITVFAKIDHQAGAKKINKTIPATVVLIFGNPKLGTPLMQCAPQVAIDLPQKILVSEDSKGNVWIRYNQPSYLAKRHNIEGCEQSLEQMTQALKKVTEKASR